jgi:hypothetical protein
MAEAGSQPLIAYPEIERWEGALRDYAGMQRVLAYHVDALHAVGVPYRGVPWLRSGLARLLADTGTLTRGRAGLSPDEIVTLRAREPELEAACTTWERSGVPISLEHGDFSPWQVQIDRDSCRFLDWSDSSLAPPFFSMLGVLGESAAGLPGVPDATSRLRDAYLSGWTGLASPHVLQHGFELAQRLAPLHHALIYYVDILPAMEQRWEMEPMLTHYLRMLLI